MPRQDNPADVPPGQRWPAHPARPHERGELRRL